MTDEEYLKHLEEDFIQMDEDYTNACRDYDDAIEELEDKLARIEEILRYDLKQDEKEVFVRDAKEILQMIGEK